MSKTSPSEGTKIAQAAKDLNVTSVTIRRYLSEFAIETETDENGVKVLPADAMEELQLIRQLKEEGLTNPKVLEELEQRRTKPDPVKSKVKERPGAKARALEPELPGHVAGEPGAAGKQAEATGNGELESAETISIMGTAEQAGAAARLKHTLTCQTCGKVFEHLNPRLRDCLDCYRTKRKERRRGGSDRHKTVIQHPVVQQVIAKSSSFQQLPVQTGQAQPVAVVSRQSTVRNYRKAIEETRGITASLKRRLERPDLPEGERRWLEQIYAYQLILHQGWRHLSEYKAGAKGESKSE